MALQEAIGRLIGCTTINRAASQFRSFAELRCKAAAKARESSGGANGSGGRGNKNPPQRIAEGNGHSNEHVNGEVREQRAKSAGTNRQYISDADKIVDKRPDLANMRKSRSVRLSLLLGVCARLTPIPRQVSLPPS